MVTAARQVAGSKQHYTARSTRRHESTYKKAGGNALFALPINRRGPDNEVGTTLR